MDEFELSQKEIISARLGINNRLVLLSQPMSAESVAESGFEYRRVLFGRAPLCRWSQFGEYIAKIDTESMSYLVATKARRLLAVRVDGGVIVAVRLNYDENGDNYDQIMAFSGNDIDGLNRFVGFDSRIIGLQFRRRV